MKKYILSVFLSIIFLNVFGQKFLRFYSGMNYTNISLEHIANYQKQDYILVYDWIVLPQFGMEYYIPVNNNIMINTGLGLSFMGCKNFLDKDRDSIDENFKEQILEYIAKNPNLKINYLKIPLLLNFKLMKNLEFYIGYSFNYVLRVNQNFFSFKSKLLSVTYEPIYYNKNYFHILNLGLRAKLDKHIDITIGGLIPLTKMADSGYNWARSNRFYYNMYGFQMSVGYLIFEEKQKPL